MLNDVEDRPLSLDIEPSNHLDTTAKATITPRQLFYILVLHAVGASIIDALANFGVACAMYRTTHKEIRMWPLQKNTIAGDMGVTVIIQGILTEIITSALVRADIRAGKVEPLALLSPRRDNAERRGWRRDIEQAISFLIPTQSIPLRNGARAFFEELFITLLRGFSISVLYFPITWPIAIAITAPLYGGIDMRGTWTPEIIKAVFGGVLGLLMNPVVATLALHGTASHPSPPPRKPRIVSTTSMGRPQAVSVETFDTEMGPNEAT